MKIINIIKKSLEYLMMIIIFWDNYIKNTWESQLFKYKITKFKFLRKFLNLSKTFKEYYYLYNLIKHYNYIYIDNKRVSSIFFLDKKYYRRNFDLSLIIKKLTY